MFSFKMDKARKNKLEISILDDKLCSKVSWVFLYEHTLSNSALKLKVGLVWICNLDLLIKS